MDLEIQLALQEKQVDVAREAEARRLQTELTLKERT